MAKKSDKKLSKKELAAALRKRLEDPWQPIGASMTLIKQAIAWLDKTDKE